MQEAKEKQSDFYQILGLSQEATYEEIYEKYLKLSLLYHPDKGGDPEKYKLVNLAYSVLKDPENRRKYNDSLATTFSQFKDEARDTKYHVTPDKTLLDQETFLQAFEETRHLQKETAEINPNQEIEKRSIEQIMADRDNDLHQFQQTQKTELTTAYDPKNNMEEFNHIFNQYKSLKENREVEVYGLRPSGDDDTCAPVGREEGEVSPEDINKMIQDFQERFEGQNVPVVTSEQKGNAEALLQMAQEHKQDRERLTDVEKYGDEIDSNFTVNFNDSDKPVLPNAH